MLEVNGHDVEQISDAVEFAFSMKGKPTVIVADTVKGKGVTLFENNVNFHGSQPKAEEWSDCYVFNVCARYFLPSFPFTRS